MTGFKVRLIACALAVLCSFFVLHGVAVAQEPQAGQAAAPSEEVTQRRVEAVESLGTLSSLLATRRDKLAEIDALKAQLKEAKEDASRKELEASIAAANEALEKVETQALAISTGVSEEAFGDDQDAPFDLQSELAELAQPFIKMMRDATENARLIEKLRRTIGIAEKQISVSEQAIKRLALLMDVQDGVGEDAASNTLSHLKAVNDDWVKRRQQANDLKETAEQQLRASLEAQANASGGLGSFATQFFRNRGLNLLLGITAVGVVLVVMNLIGRTAGWVQRRQNIPRSFFTRFVTLLFRIITIIVAFLALMAVFNAMNDWLLLGVASVFALATAWIGFKMLPGIAEQVTLLLNLGAVQEGERVMFAGVPWQVSHLDFYTDLVNPDLEGGSFTLPVRELVGLHSRPAGVNEPWFPTKREDWVQFDDGRIGQVLCQTPELVQVRELGGALVTFETSAFMAAAPRNLTSGYRIRTEFGIDYRHQHEATDKVPDQLKAHIEGGLEKLLGPDGVIEVGVDLVRAGDSAIVYEVEADIDGRFASRIEDVEREVARLLVDACNTYGWTIPFPQLVMHRAAG